jgi:ribose 5-phosphate isomerase B
VKIVIASDHRGYEKKRWLAPKLEALGHTVVDVGCPTGASCDYPDYAAPAARMVAGGEADVGILLDNSGIGMSIVANKVRGVRAAIALDLVAARLAREANHCNVLCIATELLSDVMMEKIAKEFVDTTFATGGRHDRRIKKIRAIEKAECAPVDPAVPVPGVEG